MEALLTLFNDHPLWIWLGVAAALLAIEIGTGTGWLLWSSACAAVVGVVAMIVPGMGLPAQMILFAVLTIASTLLSRRFLPPPGAHGPDINDRVGELIGKTGEAIGDFSQGAGRVLVDGAEWAAEARGTDRPNAGERIRVVRVLGGARLEVISEDR